jgi:type IV pilus assembly protein PilX
MSMNPSLSGLACDAAADRSRSGGARRQRGITMVVVLVFTLALTGLAILSARLALSGESVARNQLDLQVARQAAEAALRDAEVDLMLPTGAMRNGALCARGDERPVMEQVGRVDDTCTRGQCTYDEGARVNTNFSTGSEEFPERAEAWWPTAKGGRWGDDAEDKPREGGAGACATFTGGVPLGTFTGAQPIAGVAVQPEYLIEPVLRGEWFFRITARGFGYRAGTEVVLQSYFVVPPL